MITQTAEIENYPMEESFVSIGDVSKIIGVPTHTIRYWEKEFPKFIAPPRTIGKQRRYGTEQILKLRKIFTMLKEDGYSIAGAKRVLANQNRKANISSVTQDGIDAETAEKIILLLKQYI
ncbi:MAG: MerR family transcriptional regulator [Fibrobacteria bacterium]|nr:MerR family transcriptional regulator [Fibrobacteria bacterium]